MSRNVTGLFRRLGTVALVLLCLLVPSLGAAGLSHPARAAVSAVPANVSVTPSTIAAGGQITVTGSGFAQGETVSIKLTTNPPQLGGQPLGTATADDSGNISEVVTIPATQSPGSFLVVAQGQSSGNNGQAPLQVTGSEPAVVNVNPSTVQAGGHVSISGSGFGPNESVNLLLTSNPPQLGGQALGTATTDGSGNFSFPNATIPAGTPANNFLIVAKGTTSGQQANTPIQVTAPQAPATVSVNPTSVVAGGQVTISGTGFAPGESVNLLLQANANVIGGQALGTATTDGSGNFSFPNATIPGTTPAGTYLIVASGGFSGRSANTPLTVTAPPTPATVSVNPNSITAGGQVTIAGTGFTPGEAINLLLTSNPPQLGGLALATAVANGSGNFSIGNVTIPVSQPAGNFLIVASATSSGQRPSTPLTVTAPQAPATVSVNPTSAVAGTQVTISGANFAVGELVNLTLQANANVIGGQPLGTAAVGSNGAFSIGNITIPVTTPGGSYLIVATGTTSGRVARTPIAVTAPRASLSVNPTTFSPNSNITISGGGYVANETVTIILNASNGAGSSTLGAITANGSGAFGPTAIHVPFGVVAGNSQVAATGRSSNRQAVVNVFVNAQSPTLSVTPNTVAPGERVSLAGTNFQPGETVSVSLVGLNGTVVLASAQAAPSGSFGISGVAIPANAPQGVATLIATGNSSRLSANAQLTIRATAVHLTLSSSTVVAGNTVGATGSGFIPGETVTLILQRSTFTPINVGTVIADANGNFNINLAIPASLSGPYTVSAYGQSSGRVATASLQIQGVPTSKPAISVIQPGHTAGTPYSVSPGGLLEVVGSNFPANAAITLTLSGFNVTSTLGTVRATSAGAFGPIGLTVPASVPPGSYILGAVVSGTRVADVTVLVQTLAPKIVLSSTTPRPGQSVTVGGSGYAPGEQIVLALNGAALTTSPGTILATPGGAFSAHFTVPASINAGSNTLTATGVASRAAASIVVQGILPTPSSYYFANGDTTSGTHTTVSLLNTSGTNAAVKMTFLYANQAERTSSVSVPARTQLRVDLNLLAGAGRHVSTIVTANTRISAQSTVYYPGADNAISLGAQAPSTRWYEAEGFTGGSFRTSLVIANPNTSYVNADVHFLPFNGKPPKDVRFTVRPRSNLNIDANQYMPRQSFSMIITSDKGVMIDRTIRFGVNQRGATVGHGSTLASTIWEFAQGEASANRQTFLTILNPNESSAATVTATFYNSKGNPVGNRTIVVNPLRRGNIKLNDMVPNGQVAMLVSSSVPVVVERPLYEGPANLDQATAGVVVFGRNGGGRTWLIPGGSQGNGN
jgi:hypothetical protein